MELYMFGKGKVELLEQKTGELGIDVHKLSENSHTKVLVKCTRCLEEFKREFRNLNQLHNCPTHKTINGSRYKWCNKCKQFKPIDSFHTNITRYDGLAVYCITCVQGTGAPERRIAKLREKRGTFTGWLDLFFCKKKYQCIKYGIPFDLTVESLTDQWHKQHGRCYYSKMDLQFNSKSMNGAQLDRVEPAGGYLRTNVVWCSKAINNLKNNASIEEFTNFLNAAVFDIPVRCEFMKLAENAKIPVRKRATDAGLDIYSIEDVIIPPYNTYCVKTGIALVVPPGYYYTIEGRSGFWKKGIVPCRGIIDATYSGEVLISICNHGPNEFQIKQGERFAQLVMHRFVQTDIIEVECVDDLYADRGVAGFGSSGLTNIK